MATMELFRSEAMQLVQLIVPAESAHDTISYLGEIGLLQFRDLNKDQSLFQRTYANQVKRCGEMSRKLRFFKDQINKAGLIASSRPVLDKELDLDELETKLDDMEKELLEMNQNNEKLMRTRNELVELQLVLRMAGDFFTDAQSSAAYYQRGLEESPSIGESMDSPLLLEQEMQTDPSKVVRLGFVTGLVAKAKAMTFERILFRATRGNMFLKQAPIDAPVVDPATGEKVEKVVFVVFFAGERARMKIMKICEAFGANRYPFPEDVGKQRQMMAEVSQRLSELQLTIDMGEEHRTSVLNSIGYQLEQWIVLVRREKAVYHTLNMLSVDVTRKCLIAEAWCPVFAKPRIQDALHRAAMDSNAQVGTIFQPIQTKESPPTYFKTNKFTDVFQEIVDAYGIANYQEANPAPFTIVTFPFLFAIMFGDWGHGILMLIACLALIVNEKKLGSQKLGDIMEMAYGGRYCILLMAMFSIYTGLIYNEFFSVNLSLFGKSAFKCRSPDCSDDSTAGLIQDGHRVYPFGVDPAWHGTRTELPFLNSLKMKLSILLGVVQMFVGIILSYFNARFFSLPLNVWYEFIPQMLFLGSLFGYLSILIVIKWVTGSQADLYHVMIYMFLSPTDDLADNQLFPGQNVVQIILLLIAMVAVPWMLLPKPLIILAHAQLSAVFYERVMLNAVETGNIIAIIIGFFVFACATVGVLMIMETLSAFLHALRLHWVEFQNKFYKGEGYKFAPFSFYRLDVDDE
ncbi:hypothetical protein CBR_g4601 [Chara braunii]|uniref:V-type proton ATPase subunit a n=1 Tax=Chara braunii TaxID=69332 RepID=A0A388KI88_CHABU|nr:hypothetical protein CBR_g4601 [Chara braunii]|eukprot:GBG69770.1 hypothetical protein CBR_g4601 [Chara braunii]